VWFVSLAAALVVAVTAVLYLGTREALLEGLDAELRARAEGIGVRTEWERDWIVLEDDEDGTSSMSQIDGFEIRTWPGLDPVVAEGVLLPAADDGRPGAETHEGLRVVGVIVDRPAMDEEDEPAGPPFRVLVRTARSMTTLQGQLDRVWLLALATLLISMGTVVAFGVVVSRRVIRPLQLLADAARQVESGVAREMPDRGTGDEVDRLAGVIDGAFEALRATSERQRRFTADASHELRTPLAIVQSSAEVALRRPRDEAEYRLALSEVLTAARRMQALLEALLVLARLDAG
jgi:signal transduction histidine kinase